MQKSAFCTLELFLVSDIVLYEDCRIAFHGLRNRFFVHRVFMQVIVVSICLADVISIVSAVWCSQCQARIQPQFRAWSKRVRLKQGTEGFENDSGLCDSMQLPRQTSKNTYWIGSCT